MRYLFIISVVLGLSFIPKDKKGKIAFQREGSAEIVFYNDDLLKERLSVECCELLQRHEMPSKGIKGFHVTKVVYDTVGVKLIGDKYFLFAKGTTNVEEMKYFQVHINLTKTGNDFVILSKKNPSSFSCSNVPQTFTVEEDDYCNGSYWETKQGDSYSACPSRFEDKGLAAYFK